MATTTGPDGHTLITIFGIRFDAHRLIYATIIMLVALAIYDDEVQSFSGTRFIDLFIVVVLPLLALSFAHAFSDALDIQIKTRHRLTAHDRRHLLAAGLQYLSVGIPVLAIGILYELTGGEAGQASEWGQALGVLSLFWWGAFAARASGLGGWVQVRFAIVYGLLGFGIVMVELAFIH
jgi:hypothetical protein